MKAIRICPIWQETHCFIWQFMNLSQRWLLLAHGASPLKTDAFGNTPMHLATLFGEREIIEMLLASGAEIDATSRPVLGLHLCLP